MNEIIGAVKDDTWKVMIVDHYTISLLSNVCKISEITKQNITSTYNARVYCLSNGTRITKQFNIIIIVVESLEKSRQPFPNLAAVYFMCPSEKSIQLFIEDFEKGKKYMFAHVFTTSRTFDIAALHMED